MIGARLQTDRDFECAEVFAGLGVIPVRLVRVTDQAERRGIELHAQWHARPTR